MLLLLLAAVVAEDVTFDMLDSNGDGYITRQEFQNFVDNLRRGGRHPDSIPAGRKPLVQPTLCLFPC